MTTWTRAELEERSRLDTPEGRLPMMRVLVSPLLLLHLMDFSSQRGERVEVVGTRGDDLAVELRFFRRDGPPAGPAVDRAEGYVIEPSGIIAGRQIPDPSVCACGHHADYHASVHKVGLRRLLGPCVYSGDDAPAGCPCAQWSLVD